MENKSDSKLFRKPSAEKKFPHEGPWKIFGQKKDDEKYSMTKMPRGKALIFNHYEYDVDGIPERDGTKKDTERLNQILQKLHFQTSVHNDPTFSQIQEVIERGTRLPILFYCRFNDCLLIIICF